MIRVDAVWLATEPMDMRAGTDTALARVVKVFGAARPHLPMSSPIADRLG
jgi:transposase